MMDATLDDRRARLTSSPTGSYTYGDSAHVHAVTAIGANAYSAAYDAAGDMTCRAPSSATTCVGGSPTGQQMSYDNERRLTHWQNRPVNPTATDDFLYDGSGMRVEQDSVVSGVTTDTAYLLGGVEEVTGGAVTKYLGVAGLPTAIRVGTTGSLNYLASDGLGSVSEALDGSGNVVAAQLYTPYGQTRYASGTMPTSKGFTGQRADSVSGLDDYGARYYDPLAGQFTEADTAGDGLSPYAYVRGNPETYTDPTGKLRTCGVACGSSGGGGTGGSGSGSGSSGHHCTSDANCGCYDKCHSSGSVPPSNDPNMGPASLDTCNALCAALVRSSKGNANNQNINPASCSPADKKCQDALNAKNDATNAKNDTGDALIGITLVQLLGLGLRSLIQDFTNTALYMVALGVWTAAAVMIGLIWVLFTWESYQSVQWFENTNNITTFFNIARWGYLFVGVVLILSGLAVDADAEGGNFAAAGFAAGSIISLIGGEMVFDAAETQQLNEFGLSCSDCWDVLLGFLSDI